LARGPPNPVKQMFAASSMLDSCSHIFTPDNGGTRPPSVGRRKSSLSLAGIASDLADEPPVSSEHTVKLEPLLA
jgi:hypothetical protein